MKNDSLLPCPKTAMALVAAMAIPIIAANAGTATFTFDGFEGTTNPSETENGVTLTASNPEGGMFFDVGDGIYVSQGIDETFNFEFDIAVQIISYTVNQDFGATSGAFSLSAPGSTTSSGNDLSTGGSVDIVPTFAIGDGVTGLFDTGDSYSDGGYSILGSVTVSFVPEPGTWTLLGLGGLAAAIGVRRHRRSTQA